MTEEETISLIRAARQAIREYGLSGFSEVENYPDLTHA